MKTAKLLTRILTAGLAIGTFVVFFFNFANVTSGEEIVKLTGSELAFGGTKTIGGVDYSIAKSLYFMAAFILTAVTALFSCLSFKFKRSAWGGVIFSVLTLFVHLAIITVDPIFRVDSRPLPDVTSVSLTNNYALSAILMIVTLAVSLVAILVADYVDAKGTSKLTIPQRIAKFLRDYRSEIKKIVWPTRKATVNSTIIVLVMCAVCGAFIWALDFGLAQLIKLILKIDI